MRSWWPLLLIVLFVLAAGCRQIFSITDLDLVVEETTSDAGADAADADATD